MSTPVAVGLAGSGPWASGFLGPTLAAGPETVLTGVWSRTASHGEELAAVLGAPAVERFADLVERCEAVALAVAPDAQPGLAAQAAGRGRAVALEKPLALSVDAARRVADAVLTAGVPSLMGLTYRFAPAVRAFLADVAGFAAHGARACFVSGAYLADSPYGLSAWRRERGALVDVGPHLFDVLDVALGPVVDVRAHGNADWTGVLLTHAGGALSECSLSCSVAVMPSRTDWELLGPSGSLRCDGRADGRAVVAATYRAELAQLVRTGDSHECDVRRGLELVELVDRVEQALG